MSSFSLRAIREISNNPRDKFVNELSKKLSKFTTKDQLEFLEDKGDIYTDGQDFDAVIKFHDELVSMKSFDFNTVFYPPSEPDLDKLTLWIRGRNTGSNNMTDWSGFQNEIILFRAEPLLIDGSPFDYGTATAGAKSICQRFNRPGIESENMEHIKVTDNNRIQVLGISTGISFFIRFRMKNMASQGGFNRTLFEKIDDSTPNNAYALIVTPDGALRFHVKRAGVEYNSQTATGVIAVDTVYDVWCTYAVSGNVSHIYVNNSDKSLTDPGSPTWQSDTTSHDLFLFRRGYGTAGGFVYGDFYDFELMKEKVVSSTEVGRHFTNKWTLADIAFGEVMISNYWATSRDPSASSFTSTSFTSTSFDV